jgi:uncharacterized protein YcaQ
VARAVPEIPLAHARRLALHAQGLALPPPPGRSAAEVARSIGCLQLDPVSVVARSPLLVLRARMRGGSRASHERALERAAYRDRELFEYWCHEASLCHVDDLAIHRWAMGSYLDRLTPARVHQREWLDANADFAGEIVAALAAEGPLPAAELEDSAAHPWVRGHWTDEVSSRQTIARMLDMLWTVGRIGVADRRGPGRRWDVLERCVPAGELDRADAEQLHAGAAVRAAALRAVGLLGVARVPHINAHFIRGSYPNLGGHGRGVLGRLEADGALARVGVAGLRGEWWALPEALETAAELEPGRRTVALSPFDNLICDRARTAELFDFDHRLEIYVPPAKRRWGYYVLPLLHGERLVARADLRVDRGANPVVLRVLSLHPEPGRRAPGAVHRALTSLAGWLGAELACA